MHQDIPISFEPSFENTLHPSLAGDPLISKPTRRRDGPLAISARMRDWPGKGLGESADRLSLPALGQLWVLLVQGGEN